jgi:hypothetical protein
MRFQGLPKAGNNENSQKKAVSKILPHSLYKNDFACRRAFRHVRKA